MLTVRLDKPVVQKEAQWHVSETVPQGDLASQLAAAMDRLRLRHVDPPQEKVLMR